MIVRSAQISVINGVISGRGDELQVNFARVLKVVPIVRKDVEIDGCVR